MLIVRAFWVELSSSTWIDIVARRHDYVADGVGFVADSTSVFTAGSKSIVPGAICMFIYLSAKELTDCVTALVTRGIGVRVS
jgi:hypothetical protein